MTLTTSCGPSLSVSVVTHNAASKLDHMLKALREACRGIDAEILLVDNASAEPIEEIVRKYLKVQFVRNAANRFFTAADNQNLARARGRYIVSLNPDALPQPDSLRVMMRYLDDHGDVGAICPRFLFPDGREQACLGHFPSVTFALLEAAGINQALPWNRHNKAMWPDDLDYNPDNECEADVLYGACIMTRREVLEQVGLKDERLVHGWDEYDWCRRTRQAGWKLRYVPSAVVIHHQGASRSYQPEGILAKYHWDGFFHLVRKYYGWPLFALARVLYALRPIIMSRTGLWFICRCLSLKTAKE